MFRKLNVFVLTFFVLVQSFIMPFSASSSAYESVFMGAAMAAAEANNEEVSNDASEDATNKDDEQTASTFASNEKIDLSFEKLIYNNREITSQADAAGVKPKADERVQLFYTFATQDLNQTLEVQMPGKESLKLECLNRK